MAKLIITLETYTEIAKKILPIWQYKFYLMKLRSFLTIISKKLHKYKCTDEKEKKTFEQESDDIKYLRLEKKRIDDFLEGEITQFNEDNKELSHIINDRIIQKVSHKTHNIKERIKQKAIKTALGGNSVLSFFNSIGIAVKTEIFK